MQSPMRLILYVLTVLASIKPIRGALPQDLTNFQNEHPCDPSVRIVRPRSIEDVRKAVLLHDSVAPVGAGCSYDAPFFCARPSDATEATSANIVMTTIRPLTIQVDEVDESVWVSAGVRTWDLIIYLGNYVTAVAPRGYALPATPFYANQTIGGAIATNTHGNSFKHGSLSNQVLGFKVVLANGTSTEITPEGHPLLFKAFQVNVGRLGVVTEVKMRIVPETLVKRTFRRDIPQQQMMAEVQGAQDMYRSSGQLPDWFQEEFFFLVNPVDFTFSLYTLEPLPELETLSASALQRKIQEAQVVLSDVMTRINRFENVSRQESGKSVAEGMEWQLPMALPPNALYADVENMPQLMDLGMELLAEHLGNATTETHEASLRFPQTMAATEEILLHDDHEIAVSVENMADCLRGLLDFMQTEVPDNSLRSTVGLRMVGKEDGLLSVSHDGPKLWFSSHDFLYYNIEPRSPNVVYKRLVAYFATNPACSPGRRHWGKAGFPDPGCWNGADDYGVNWCHFGCAVRVLDPGNKFMGSARDRWNWNGANLDACCTEQGYDSSVPGCTCSAIPMRTAQDCPPAPFYTYR